MAGVCTNNDEPTGAWAGGSGRTNGGWIVLGKQMFRIQMCPWVHRDLVKEEANKSLGKRTRPRNGWGTPRQVGSGHSHSWKQWRGFDGSAVVSVSVRVHFGTLAESRLRHPKCGPQPLKYDDSGGRQILPGAARFPFPRMCSLLQVFLVCRPPPPRRGLAQDQSAGAPRQETPAARRRDMELD